MYSIQYSRAPLDCERIVGCAIIPVCTGPADVQCRVNEEDKIHRINFNTSRFLCQNALYSSGIKQNQERIFQIWYFNCKIVFLYLPRQCRNTVVTQRGNFIPTKETMTESRKLLWVYTSVLFWDKLKVKVDENVIFI